MQWILIAALIFHLVPGVFWAGSSFVLARGAIPAEASLGLRASQRGAAVVVILAGLLLGYLTRRAGMGPADIALGVGASAALVAAGLQVIFGLRAARAIAAGAFDEARRRQLLAFDRLSAALLALTVALMAASKYL